MEVRFLDDHDYDVLAQWWKDWRWSAPPKDMLPQDGRGGLMVSKDGEDIVPDLFTLLTQRQLGLSTLYQTSTTDKTIAKRR